MTIQQLRAIGYAERARANKRREEFIKEREGSLDEFRASRYKSMFWYILAKYGKRIY